MTTPTPDPRFDHRLPPPTTDDDAPDPDAPERANPPDTHEGATGEQVGHRGGPGVGYDQEPERVEDEGGVS